MSISVSVLIASFNRPEHLRNCLESLRLQTVPPDEILVIWQREDIETKWAAEAFLKKPFARLKIIHNPVKGIVPSENLGLRESNGEFVFLIDDDAVAPPGWIENHLRHYRDQNVGAVGGPYKNHTPDLKPFPIRRKQALARLTWYGKPVGHMYDHPPEWASRGTIDVDHLVGNNFSFRREAVGGFEVRLRPYWAFFELEACMQIKKNGYRVLFDFANVIKHYPTNTAFAGGRDGDLAIKIFNPAFNLGYVLSKHTRGILRIPRFAYWFLIGNISMPGTLGALASTLKYGDPRREFQIWRTTARCLWNGWQQGRRFS